MENTILVDDSDEDAARALRCEPRYVVYSVIGVDRIVTFKSRVAIEVI